MVKFDHFKIGRHYEPIYSCLCVNYPEFGVIKIWIVEFFCHEQAHSFKAIPHLHEDKSYSLFFKISVVVGMASRCGADWECRAMGISFRKIN